MSDPDQRLGDVPGTPPPRLDYGRPGPGSRGARGCAVGAGTILGIVLVLWSGVIVDLGAVESRSPGTAPSKLLIVGGYVLVAIAAGTGWIALRGGRRLFFASFLLTIGICCLLEGVCFSILSK